MKLSNYIQANAERVSTMSNSQDIAQILSGGQDITKSRAYALRNAIEVVADSFDDETAQEYPELYPQWEAGVEYEAGTSKRVCYNGLLYSIEQDHTSQVDWPPDKAVSLYSQVLTNADGTPAQWAQPDSTNGYKYGDVVIYSDDLVYRSIYQDLNVWSPEAYPAGWECLGTPEEYMASL